MAHLFIASKITMADDPLAKSGPKGPKSTAKPPPPTASDKKVNKDCCVVTTTVPLINEVQLSAATGGTEMSCYRCTVPFGVVVLIAGVVVTAVAYTFNSHGSTISVLGLVLLSGGLLLLGSSALCWRLRMSKKEKDRRRESQTALMASHGVSVA
ncbi:transmembrane protein 100-like [Aplochiton taeniatus]